MVAPIDYTTQVASPFASAVQGVQFGAGIADRQVAIQKQELAAQEQRAALNELAAIENPSAKDYSRATLLLPGMKDSIKQAWEMQAEGQKRESLAELGSVYSALSTDNPGVAIDILNRRADATENSGGSSAQIDAARRMAKLIEISPDLVRTQVGIQLAGIPDGDKIIEGAAKLSETRRKEGLHPSEIKKAAADIGKTEAETKKLLAEVDKLGADAQKAVLELEKGDPSERFNQEEKLRKEYTKRAGGFIESRRIFDNLNASATAGAPGDIALITSFMKMLDPGSVVRETEFATAQDTGGLLTKLGNIATKIEKGEFLSESQRKSFVSLAKRYMDAAEKEEGGVRKDLEKVVDNYGLNAENVFGTRADIQEEPVAAEITPAAQVAPDPAEVDALLLKYGG